jgi:hypothetical protein
MLKSRIKESMRIDDFAWRAVPWRYGIGEALTTFILVATFGLTLAQNATSTQEVGPKVGEQLPAFQARDQFGHQQTLSSLTGPKGLVLLFVRSADW